MKLFVSVVKADNSKNIIQNDYRIPSHKCPRSFSHLIHKTFKICMYIFTKTCQKAH